MNTNDIIFNIVMSTLYNNYGDLSFDVAVIQWITSCSK